MKFKTFGFIGLGLIGGSIAKAIRKINPESYILAYGPHPEKFEAAIQGGILNEIVTEIGYAFHKCDGNIRNINGSEITVTQLDRLWANKEQFGLFIYLNEQEFIRKPDLETDLKMWIQDSQKIMNIAKLSDEEKMFHLPKKDFKIDFDNGNCHAVLKNCKFAKLLSSIKKANGEPMITSFAMIIERIIFTKN